MMKLYLFLTALCWFLCMDMNNGFKYVPYNKYQVSLLNRVHTMPPFHNPRATSPVQINALKLSSTTLFAENEANQELDSSTTKSIVVGDVQSSEVVVKENSVAASSTAALAAVPSSPSLLSNFKSLLTGKGWNGKHVLSREKLAKMGLNVLLSYGFVSNVSYITCMMFSWVAFGKKYGISPLAKGQWKAFLLIYSGFWAANNILRPARFSLSLVLLPLFDKLISFFQRKLNLSKAKATGLTIFLVNFCGTISFLVLGLMLSTSIAKVPLLP